MDSVMVLVVLVRMQNGRCVIGCVGVDQRGVEAWLVQQGYQEGVEEWTKLYSDPTEEHLQTATAEIVLKPLIEAAGC